MKEADLWQTVLGEIELSVSHGKFITWFKTTRLLKVSPELVVIGVQNIFFKQQMESKYHDMIQQTLAKNGYKEAKIEFKIYSSLAPKKNRQQEDMVVVDSHRPSGAQTSSFAGRRPDGNGHKSSIAHAYRPGLNDRYTFDNFVVGAGNELAYAACQGIAQMPGTKYNPLFLYGGVGIGKTHLVQAVGNTVRQRNPQANIVYASTEQFVQEFVDALRFKKNTEFATYYRSADVLIMDDIQFFEGKEKVQEEFFHTFNALYQGNKQIVISSDKQPKDIPTLEDRLRSRLTWGMAIDMQTPDYETRCAIIKTKAAAHELNLPEDLIDFLSTRIQTNIRDLESELNRVLAFCEMRSLEPDLAIATGLLGTAKPRPRHISAKQIVERTAKHFQISIEDIVGAKRDKDIVVPRQVAM
ncbi:MAG: chromosomal replication initiator protein DnaA, partial [Candidatus Saccharimonadales bacterium]